MPVLSRDALEASPLADLHTIAGEIGLDGYRRLRKDDLVAAIIERQGGEPAAPDAEADVDAGDDRDRAPAAGTAAERAERRDSRRGSRGGRGRARAKDEREEREEREPRTTRGSRGAREPREEDRDGGEERSVEGVVEVLGNGSGFVRLNPPEAGDDDVYVSAAQVRRCELVSGDRISGPVRRARRSERYPSLVRVETINGAAADEVADGTPFDQLPAVFPTEPIAFTAKDATLKEIADLAPFGRGSRVTVLGGPGSGRTTTLRAIAIELAALEGVELHLALAGTRPEELPEWAAAELTPAASATLAATADAQAQVIERVLDAARRAVARGGHAAVVIDALDQLAPQTARRALAAARSVPDGGSLTIVAAARGPVGGETTIIALDNAAAAVERRPVVNPQASGTLRLEALVGARKATTIAKNRLKQAEPAA